VPVISTGDIQPVRIGKYQRISIGGAQQQYDSIPSADPAAIRARFHGRVAQGLLSRRLVPQKLFDRRRHELGLSEKCLQLIAVL
jgi:hypothetical protein